MLPKGWADALHSKVMSSIWDRAQDDPLEKYSLISHFQYLSLPGSSLPQILNLYNSFPLNYIPIPYPH